MEKAARTTQQTFNGSIILVGAVMTVGRTRLLSMGILLLNELSVVFLICYTQKFSLKTVRHANSTKLSIVSGPTPPQESY